MPGLGQQDAFRLLYGLQANMAPQHSLPASCQTQTSLHMLADMWALLYQVTMCTSEYLMSGTGDHLSVMCRLYVRHQPRACTLATL
jgi:hypothetical protein